MILLITKLKKSKCILKLYGYFNIPKGPGWGVEIDYDYLESNPPKTENGIILDPGLNMFKSENWNKRD